MGAVAGSRSLYLRQQSVQFRLEVGYFSILLAYDVCPRRLLLLEFFVKPGYFFAAWLVLASGLLVPLIGLFLKEFYPALYHTDF